MPASGGATPTVTVGTTGPRQGPNPTPATENQAAVAAPTGSSTAFGPATEQLPPGPPARYIDRIRSNSSR